MGSSNSRLLDQYFIRRRQNQFDIYYLSQAYFDLPKRNIRNNSNKTILFNQTIKDIEHIYTDVAGYDMSYDEFEELCRKLWKDVYNYLCIDRFKKRDRGRYCVCNGNKNTYIDCTPQTKAFRKRMILIHTRTLICVIIKKLFFDLFIKSTNKILITHIGVENIHTFLKQSHSHSFKSYIQLKIENIWKN